MIYYPRRNILIRKEISKARFHNFQGTFALIFLAAEAAIRASATILTNYA